MLDTVLDTVRAEFSDVADVGQITRIALRLLLAALLGGVLGYEREQRGKAAGIRTHMLVAMGSAMFVLIPQQGGMAIADISRVLQGIVAGIGFLGAGAIIKQRDEQSVQGLTTAAGVWLTAAIGIACGMGRESTAVISTVLALAVLLAVPRIFESRRDADGELRPEGSSSAADRPAAGGEAEQPEDAAAQKSARIAG